MVLSLSTDPAVPAVDRDAQRALLAIARTAIAGSTRDSIDPEALPPTLLRKRAVFVTLTEAGKLRGCIGSVTAEQPLVYAVADAAYGAAHRDPRFPSLQAGELAAIRIEISVLSELELIPADSHEALLASLRPRVDGLLLEDGLYRSTFLPKVWEQLPRAAQFLSQLLTKAGLPPDHWSSSLRAHRYTASNFSEDQGTGRAESRS